LLIVKYDKMSNLRNLFLYLDFLKNISSSKLVKLAKKYETCKEEIFNDYIKSRIEIDNIKVEYNNTWEKEVEHILQKMYRYNIKFVNFLDIEYPELLREINNPPFNIYYIGDLGVINLKNTITIVGTRKVSKEGEKSTRLFVQHLTKLGITTISGMALGVDKIVHEETIKNGGKTIAVLPFTPHIPTPYQNKEVYTKILDTGGIIISEFLENVKKSPNLFPIRNRILAGLSMHTLVTEASLDSGALITAELAFSYNRNVYAIPNSIYFENAKGCNKLIKTNKAKLVEHPSEIVEEMGFKQYNLIKNINILKNDNENNLLTQEEKLIIEKLSKSSMIIDQLIIETSISLDGLNSILFEMEMKGYIKKSNTGEYELI